MDVVDTRLYQKPHFVTKMLTYSALQRKGVKEVQVNLRTGVPCRHGKCAFCSVKDKEESRRTPLTYDELHAQVSKGLNGRNSEKLVLISNSHSTFSQDVMENDAIRKLLISLKDAGITELGLETRLDIALQMKDALLALHGFARSLGIKLEIASGIETPDEYERNFILQKGLSDAVIIEAAASLSEIGIGLRTYFIYRHPLSGLESDFNMEFRKLCDTLEFLDQIRPDANSAISLYVIPGYAMCSNALVVLPSINEVASAMQEAANLARTLDIRMVLDPVEDDISMTNSGTKRKIDSQLRSTIENNNFFGWR